MDKTRRKPPDATVEAVCILGAQKHDSVRPKEFPDPAEPVLNVEHVLDDMPAVHDVERPVVRRRQIVEVSDRDALEPEPFARRVDEPGRVFEAVRLPAELTGGREGRRIAEAELEKARRGRRGLEQSRCPLEMPSPGSHRASPSCGVDRRSKRPRAPVLDALVVRACLVRLGARIRVHESAAAATHEPAMEHVRARRTLREKLGIIGTADVAAHVTHAAESRHAPLYTGRVDEAEASEALREPMSSPRAGPLTFSVRRPRLDVAVAAVAVLAVCVNFGSYRVFGDGEEYYSFVQRLFGDRPSGSGYNFGTGLMNAPFYGLARVAKAVVGSASIAAHALPASITIAAIAYMLLAFAISVDLVGRLGLPARGFVAGAAVLGTPLWYYASLSSSYTHATDAAAFSLAAAAAARATQAPTGRWYLGFGAALGLEVAVRPYNLGVVAGACIALVGLRRVRAAVGTAVASAVSFGILVLVPVGLGTGLFTRSNGAQVGNRGTFGVAPLTPVRMLFTDHRGLFIWTPLTLLSTIGFILLLRRPSSSRSLLVVLGSMVLGLLLAHATLVTWDAGWSFSMRLLASPLPFYAIGLAGLLDSLRERWRPWIVALASACVAWSLYLGLCHAFGASQESGAVGVATTHSPRAFLHLIWSYSRVRHVIDRL
jgi:hypothetical protein